MVGTRQVARITRPDQPPNHSRLDGDLVAVGFADDLADGRSDRESVDDEPTLKARRFLTLAVALVAVQRGDVL